MKVSNILATRLARRTNNKGLTLIELLVVLVILIALAGILIPQLPNMLTRTHAAAASTNIPEANKRIQEFEQLYFKQPANLDNLVNGTALVDYLPTATPFTALALDADTAEALEEAGIISVAELVATAATFTTDQNATFNPYTGTNTTVAAAVNVAQVTEADVENLIRPDAGAGDVYVAFGIGQASELTGRTMSDAPYHFGEGPNSAPEAVYARYLAIYKVEDDAGGALEKAAFIGVLALHDDGLANANAHIGEFFETTEL